MKINIGIADTTFSRVDMGKMAINEIENTTTKVSIIRYTVPGMKDLPVACKILFEKYNCEICIALGMPGPEEKDKICAHEASQGIIMCQLMIEKHIIECFVHEDEGNTPKELITICENRARKHAQNVLKILFEKDWLIKNAGMGLRQGHPDAGPIRK
ncbi:MAG: riboflavin synthase [Candidatus Lokiarchaeota archaeon]|nr:riboflavin synthase [Candidatus Lokiarchaeota archaeon]